eukprot:6641813-Lingulodinium_polyedra.AAC.1
MPGRRQPRGRSSVLLHSTRGNDDGRGHACVSCERDHGCSLTAAMRLDVRATCNGRLCVSD